MADKNLPTSESHCHLLQAGMMDAFASVDMSGRFIEFNDLFQQMLGYEREELLDLTYKDFTPERWHEFEAGIIERQVMVHGHSGVYEKEYRRKDGTIFPVELRVILVRDAAGTPVSMWAIMRDITKRKQAEEVLSERLAFERLLADLSTHFINMPADQVDLGIEDAQRRVCECLSLDLSALWQWTEENPEIFRLTHYHRPPGGPTVPDIMTGDEYFPWSQRAIREGKTIIVPSVDIYLKEEYTLLHGHTEIVGQSQAIQKVFAQIEQVAPTDSNVLILVETGTGKELVARENHALSERKDRLMVTVNCAALPASLIESELFGREKDAYTGALARQIGRFEMADGGTIFLDEIGELSLELQSKLLRVIQQGEFERLGGPTRTIRVNVRGIAATNKKLAEAVRKGDYRKDLYYRLSVFPVHVPPLRERIDDIPLLVWAFVDEFGSRMGKKIDTISQKSMDMLKSYTWPGNVRELRNAVERAMIVSRGSVLEVHVADDPEAGSPTHLTLEEVERQHILDTLNKTRWHIKGPGGAAVLLGINPSTLSSRMQKR